MNNKLSPEIQADIEKRLQRLEGQVRGVSRMLTENRDCPDVLTQLSAIRGAAYQISLLLVENYAMECISRPDENGSTRETVAKLVSTLGKLA